MERKRQQAMNKDGNGRGQTAVRQKGEAFAEDPETHEEARHGSPLKDELKDVVVHFDEDFR